MNTNTGSIQQQLQDIYVNLGGVMAPGQNSNSYSVQGWLAKIAEQTEGGVGGGGGGPVTSPEVITTPTGIVYRFTQPTKPTQRPSGPLGIGDQWYNPSTGVDGFWNGTHWLSIDKYSQTVFRDVFSSATVTIPSTITEYRFSPIVGKSYFLEEITYRVFLAAATDSNNHWALEPRLFRADGIFQSLVNADGIDTSTAIIAPSGHVSGVIPAGFTFIPTRADTHNYISFGTTFVKVGSPDLLGRPTVAYTWREVL